MAKIKNNLKILDCGSGFLGTEDRLLNNYKNLKIHTVTKVNDKYKGKIIKKIKEKNLDKKIKQHFCDFKDLDFIS